MNVEFTKISDFKFRTSKTHKNDKQAIYDEQFKKERILEFATLSKYFDDVEYLYMFMEDYLYNIYIPFKKGHKLVIDVLENDNSVSGYLTANVYSTNYQEIMNESKKPKVKKR